MAGKDSSGISFTAYYTGEVWRRHGLSVPFLVSRPGRWLYRAGRPLEWAAQVLLGGNNESLLLQRHAIIDHVLERLVREQGFSQIVEVACGLSPRGTRMMQQFADRDLHYIEADLPAMAAHKRKLLAAAGVLSARHRVLDIDILAQDSALSLQAVMARELDAARKTLVITEGLVNYFDYASIHGFWTRLAQSLKAFPQACYVTDLYPDLRWHRSVRVAQVFKAGLALATRSTVTLHFDSEQAMQAGMRSAGFAATTVHLPESYYGVLTLPVLRTPSLVRVLENHL